MGSEMCIRDRGYSASLTLGDFTHDGKIDVLVTNAGSNQLVVLHGRGDGTFSLPALAATIASPRALAAGDFNDDGWLDAATANGANNVSVLISDRSWPVPVAPNVSINNVIKNEGRAGLTSFSFTVELSQVSIQAVTVKFATANGTATTGDNDYLAAVGTITIGVGQKSATITISVRGDKRKEASETFYVNLTSATNATITDAQGVGTITNDDGGGKGPKSGRTTAVPVDLLFPAPKKRK